LRFLYLILICFAAPVAALIGLLRGVRDPARRERLADRWGRPQLTGQGPTLWVHAASMGEVQAGAVLIRELLTRYPQHRVLVTTMTATGAARVRTLFGDRVQHCYLPYDLPFAVRSFLDRVQPQSLVILETELWPMLLHACVARRIPVLVASARISPRTSSRYRRLRGLFAASLQQVVVAAQTFDDAERFRALGAANVRVVGNLKFDMDVPPTARDAGSRLRAEADRRFIWVAGSTHAGEEAAVLTAHRALRERVADALLIVVPRHPQRFEEVRALLVASGLPFASRSAGNALSADITVLFGDTMGELLNFYAAADVAFVGGSLVPVGGHNLLEPAALTVPILCGPYLDNTREVATMLINEGAAKQVASAEGLARQLQHWAQDEKVRRTAGQAGVQSVDANRGALARILALIAPSRLEAADLRPAAE
jgi:3-deoxy-D-manno-octulosonic-acid transferase